MTYLIFSPEGSSGVQNAGACVENEVSACTKITGGSLSVTGESRGLRPLAHEVVARDAGFRRHDEEGQDDEEGNSSRRSLSLVTPAEAGVSGRTLMRLLHEMPAFAGMTWRAGMTKEAGTTGGGRREKAAPYSASSNFSASQIFISDW